ncbi:hypothetical protein BRARA_B03856 [Brassica rapa]|uniref:DEK-C domain-containing protein n=1 Tax=Brassica campestris TaxID=3711 RepID=A0A398AGJ8_BRACM|nr:hypothetical protein BRARA_B03856 [Brassica rapa]
MATETLEETTTPEVKSPAKDEIGAGDGPKEREEDEDGSKGGKLEDKDEEEGSVSKNSSVTQSSSERPTRERKKVERFSLPSPTRAIPNKSVSIEKGLGTPLREIPNVAHQLSKRKADGNLILLHTILYGKKAKMIKKNISQFSGFVWSEEEEEKQRAKVKEKLDKCIKEKLIFFCDVLDIPINRSHIKKVKVAFKVLEFLESPKATRDVILADQEKEAKERKSTQKKRKSGESSDTPAKRKRQAKKGDHPSDKEVGKDEGDSDSEDSKDTHEEDVTAPEEEDCDHEKTETEEERDEAEDEKKPSDKKTSSKKISSGTKDSKKSAEKSSKRVAKPTSSPAKKQKVDHDDESSKEKSKRQLIKPQAKGSKEKGKASKKGKAEPTREEMFEVVTKMLKEVDFNTATLSDILQKLSDHFGVDLLHRKKEVKGVITDAISQMSDVEDEESEAGSDKEKEEEVKAEAGSDKEKAEDHEKLED